MAQPASLAAHEQRRDKAATMRAKPSAIETGTLGKAIAVLDIIAQSPKPLRFTDILAQSPQPRGTLYRQIKNLVAEGLLEVKADYTYALGLRLLQLASSAWSGNEFRRIAEPHLHALQLETGEAVHLGILEGQQVIYLDKVESQQSVRMHSRIGNASPSYCTGVGKAALSVLPEHAIRERMADATYVRYTPTTIVGIDKLLDEIAKIRKRGFAWDREEHEPGIRCIAAPIYAHEQNIVAAVSVTAPVFRVVQKQLEAWVPLVQRTARAIETDIAARLSPRS